MSTKVQITGIHEEIRCFTPVERKKTIKEYLKNRITPTPGTFVCDSPSKIKPVSSKSITLNTSQLSPLKYFEKNALEGKRTKSQVSNKKKKSIKRIVELKKINIGNLNDSIEYVPENVRIKAIGSPSSTLINRHNLLIEPLKTLNDLKYLIYSRPNKSPISPSRVPPLTFLPRISKSPDPPLKRS